jgi:hypothetical protein
MEGRGEGGTSDVATPHSSKVKIQMKKFLSALNNFKIETNKKKFNVTQIVTNSLIITFLKFVLSGTTIVIAHPRHQKT